MAIHDVIVRIGADISDYTKSMGRVKDSMNQVNAEMMKTTDVANQYSSATKRASDSSSQLSNSAKDSTGGLSEQEREMRKAEEAARKYHTEMAAAARTVSAVMSSITVAMVGGIGTVVYQASQFEDAFTGVRKTVSGTEADFKILEGELRGLTKELPRSSTEIAGVAEEAGRLGVKKEDISKFTKTMIMMGDSSDMAAADAAKSMARFMNIMGTSEDQVENLGSAITHMGNNTASSESEILELSRRLAGASNQIGLSEGDVVGLAATMSDLGIRAEMGGTAMQKTFLNMNSAVMAGGDELEAFASVAGMSADQFKASFEQDAGSAVVAFLAGLDGMKASGQDVSLVLQDLGLNNERTKDTLLRLSSAHGDLKSNMDMSSEAYKKGTALSEEAEKRYATFSSKVKLLMNRFREMAITIGQPLMAALSDLMDAFDPLISFVEDLVSKFDNLDDSTKKTIAKVALFVTGVTGLTAAIAMAAAGFHAFQSSVLKTNSAVMSIIGKSVKMSGKFSLIASIVMILITYFGDLDAVVDAVKGGFDKLKGIVEPLAPVLVGMAGTFVALRTAAMGYQAALILMNTAMGLVKKAQIAYTAVVTAGSRVMAAARTAQIAFTTATTGATTVMGIATTALGALKVAFRALTGPVGWVTAGLSALGGAIYGAYKWLTKASDEEERFAAETEKVASATEEVNSSLKDNQAQREESAKSKEAETQATDDLMKKVMDLSEKENKSAGDKVQLQSMVDQLNDSYDDLNLTYDKNTDTMSSNGEALENRLDLMKEETKMRDAQEQQLKVQEDINKAEAELKNIAKYREKYNEELENSGSYSSETQEKVEELDKQEKELKNTVDELESSRAEYEETATKAADNIAKAYADSAASQKISYDKMNADGQAMADNMKQHYDNILESATNMFDKIPEKAEVSFADMKKNLEHNQQAIREWAENLDKMAEWGVSEGLIDRLREAGPESAAQVAEIVKQGKKEAVGLGEVFDEGTEVAEDSLMAGLDLSEETEELIQELVKTMIKTFRDEIDGANFEDFGEQTGDDFSDGLITGSKSHVVPAIQNLTNDVKKGTTANLGIVGNSSTTFQKYGKGTMGGLGAGFESAKSGVTRKADNVYASVNTKTVKGMEKVVSSNKTGVGNVDRAFIPLPGKVGSSMNKTSARMRAGAVVQKGEMVSLAAGLKTPFNGISGAFGVIGGNIMSGLQGGMNSKKDSVLGTASRIASSVTGVVQKALRVFSPSRVMRDIGGYVVEGLDLGMKDNIRDIVKTSERIADAAIPEQPKVQEIDYRLMQRGVSGQALAVSSQIQAEASGFNTDKADEKALLGDIRDELRKQKQMIIQMDEKAVGKAVEPHVTKQQGRKNNRAKKKPRGGLR